MPGTFAAKEPILVCSTGPVKDMHHDIIAHPDFLLPFPPDTKTDLLVPGGYWFRFRGLYSIASHICRCDGFRLSGCALLWLFLNSMWQIPSTFKTAWSESCFKCQKASKPSPQGWRHMPLLSCFLIPLGSVVPDIRSLSQL